MPQCQQPGGNHPPGKAIDWKDAKVIECKAFEEKDKCPEGCEWFESPFHVGAMPICHGRSPAALLLVCVSYRHVGTGVLLLLAAGAAAGAVASAVAGALCASRRLLLTGAGAGAVAVAVALCASRRLLLTNKKENKRLFLRVRAWTQ